MPSAQPHEVPLFLEDVSSYWEDFYSAFADGDLDAHGYDDTLAALHADIEGDAEVIARKLAKYFERLNALKERSAVRGYRDPNDEHRLSKAQLGLGR